MRVSRRQALAAASLTALTASLAGCSAEPQDTPTLTPTPIALPARPRVYFFGDSWTQGYSAAPGAGYAYVMSSALQWTPSFAPDGSGTGYVHVNSPGAPTSPERAAALPARLQTDIVILQGSINDEAGQIDALDDAVASTVSALKKRTSAPIIMLGPAPASAPTPSVLQRVDAVLQAQAARLALPYVSPVQGRWINEANVGAVIDRGTGHPDTAGHAYFGGRVAAAVLGLVSGASS